MLKATSSVESQGSRPRAKAASHGSKLSGPASCFARPIDRRTLLAGMAALGGASLLGLTGCDRYLEKESGKLRIAMVFNAPINDGGWGSSCYEAMVLAAEECGWETAYSENVATADYGATMQAYIDMGYDLVYLPGNEYQNSVLQVSKDNPDAKFLVLNGTEVNAGIQAAMPDALQIGQCAGALAGLLTKTNNIGFIGGIEIDTTLQKLEGYTQAAQKVNPDVRVTSAYAGSFNDAAKGKEIATSMCSSNAVDVLFGDASVVDAGAREAQAAFPGTYNIGQPNDLGGKDDPLVPNSVVTDNVVLIVQCMRDYEAGDYGGRTVLGDLSNGGVSIGTFSDIVPADVREEYLEIVDAIERGAF